MLALVNWAEPGAAAGDADAVRSFEYPSLLDSTSKMKLPSRRKHKLFQPWTLPQPFPLLRCVSAGAGAETQRDVLMENKEADPNKAHAGFSLLRKESAAFIIFRTVAGEGCQSSVWMDTFLEHLYLPGRPPTSIIVDVTTCSSHTKEKTHLSARPAIISACR